MQPSPKQIALALNDNPRSIDTAPMAAMAIAVNDAGVVPDWIPLIPGGQAIGIDGREWVNDDPEGVVAEFDRDALDGREIPLDWNHASEKALEEFPSGEDPAPAAGWIDRLEIRGEGAIWGHVKWNDGGRRSVGGRHYRYISPVFSFDANTKRILKLFSAALTNQPNFTMPALNQSAANPKEKKPMDKLLALLGLNKDASEDEIFEAAKKNKVAADAAQKLADDLKLSREANTELEAKADEAEKAAEAAKEEASEAKAAAQANVVDINRYVPRAEFDKASAEVARLKAQIAERETKERDDAIAKALNEAKKAGKITPESVDFYRASCQQDGGLERFKAFCETAPKIVSDKPVAPQAPRSDGQAEISDDDTAACQVMGTSAEETELFKRDKKAWAEKYGKRSA